MAHREGGGRCGLMLARNWWKSQGTSLRLSRHLRHLPRRQAPCRECRRTPSFKVAPSLSRESRVSQDPPRKSQNPKPTPTPTPTPFRTASGLVVERFNGRISDVLRTNRFDSALDLEQTLMRYVHLYNTQLPQSALGSRTPMQAMKDWHKSYPQLFVKRPTNHTGRDIDFTPDDCGCLGMEPASRLCGIGA